MGSTKYIHATVIKKVELFNAKSKTLTERTKPTFFFSKFGPRLLSHSTKKSFDIQMSESWVLLVISLGKIFRSARHQANKKDDSSVLLRCEIGRNCPLKHLSTRKADVLILSRPCFKAQVVNFHNIMTPLCVLIFLSFCLFGFSLEIQEASYDPEVLGNHVAKIVLLSYAILVLFARRMHSLKSSGGLEICHSRRVLIEM